MKRTILMLISLVVSNSVSVASDPCMVTHWQFQAVHEDGTSSFDDSGPTRVILEGIVLNSPEQWLDPTADDTVGPWLMGGQWEVYFQGEGSDHAGTAMWMGQNYGNGPGYENYTNEDWRAEICRLNHDPCAGYVFNPGDRVRVTGRYLFYKGKLNVNENHEIGTNFDFTVELVRPAVGLPEPESVAISDLKDGNDDEIFDPTRLTGCEYYQSRLIRINDVNIVDTNDWGTDNTITIQDANGLTFPVLLGIGAGIDSYPCPSGQIDVIGILDQEAPGTPPNIDNTKGYRLLVLNYDGNGLVLTDRGYKRGNLPGDINADFKVDFKDFAQLAQNWLHWRDGLYGCQ